MNSLLVSFLVALAAAFCHAQTSQNLTNVKSALFRNGDWNLNVNYLSANSSDFWHTFVLKAECETIVQFQEIYCLGKSIYVSIKDKFDSTNMRNLSIISNEAFNCSSNVQNPDVAALDPQYAKGQARLPKGVYEISMKLYNYTNVLGYRGYAVKASVPIDRLVVASKCRERHNPNM